MVADRPETAEDRDLNAEASSIFRSSDVAAHSPAVLADPGRVRARKRAREVQVRFAREDCTVQSPEGIVYARTGDALLTGSAGEHWRVSRGRFDTRYRPAPGTAPWTDGAYLAVPREVLALRLLRPFTVILTDGRSELHGHPGDWLVDYGDGSLGVVGAAIFDSTYEIAG